MKQTAVEWIVDQMLSEGHKEMWKDMIQQAKQMEKEQIIDIIKLDKWRYDNAGHYFAETYESKGSDEIKGIGSKDINGNEIIFPIYSKTEISDEEILKEAIEHSNLYTNKFTPRNAFIMGAKWYREQLKQINK